MNSLFNFQNCSLLTVVDAIITSKLLLNYIKARAYVGLLQAVFIYRYQDGNILIYYINCTLVLLFPIFLTDGLSVEMLFHNYSCIRCSYTSKVILL